MCGGGGKGWNRAHLVRTWAGKTERGRATVHRKCKEGVSDGEGVWTDPEMVEEASRDRGRNETRQDPSGGKTACRAGRLIDPIQRRGQL